MKKIISVLLIMASLLMSMSFTSAFLIDEPMEISLKSHTCLGGSYCLVGEEISLNLKFNQNAKLKQSEVKTRLTSNIPGLYEDIPINSTESNIDIPLRIPISINDGEYKLSIDTSLVEYSGLIDNFLLWIKHIFSSTSTENIDVRYPKVEVFTDGDDCNKKDKNYYFDRIGIQYRDKLPSPLNCKIRIYVDKDTNTLHSLLIKQEHNKSYDYFETNYQSLNYENTLTLQQVKFTPEIDTQITNTYIIPICNIDNKEVEIKNQIKKIERCEIR